MQDEPYRDVRPGYAALRTYRRDPALTPETNAWNRKAIREHNAKVRAYERAWHTIYKLYDAKDRLLYVGISVNGPARLPQHASTKRWWRKVVRCEFEHVKGRAAAGDRERELILELAPLWNGRYEA